jgi:hypothetical protein
MADEAKEIMREYLERIGALDAALTCHECEIGVQLSYFIEVASRAKVKLCPLHRVVRRPPKTIDRSFNAPKG